MNNETKTERILWLYDALREGEEIDRAEWAAEHQVSERSVRRDIETIRGHLAEKGTAQSLSAETVRQQKGRYSLRSAGGGFIKEGELLAVCKILLESRAFAKKDVESLLDRLLQSVVSDEGRQEIRDTIANELFNYLDPKHRLPDMNLLWTAAKAVKGKHILEFDYYKMNSTQAERRRVRPVGLLFSEYYFYLMGIVDSERGVEEFQRSGPRTYRLDRMENAADTEETFSLPYSERFKEGEFKNKVQFMYGGVPYKITFRYFGPSVEAVLDRLPTARITEETAEAKTVCAEVAGPGILMWLLSQGSMVEVLTPEPLRKRWLAEAGKILERAERMKN